MEIIIVTIIGVIIGFTTVFLLEIKDGFFRGSLALLAFLTLWKAVMEGGLYAWLLGGVIGGFFLFFISVIVIWQTTPESEEDEDDNINGI